MMKVYRGKNTRLIAFFHDILIFFQIAGCLNVDTSDSRSIEGSIYTGGVERTYLVHVPTSHDKEKPMPLIIALHGGGGTGRHMMRLTLGGFNTLSEEEGFVVVYPDAIGRHWNSGRADVIYSPFLKDIEDVTFISELVDHMVDKYNVDKGRVCVMGMSNGGFIPHRLACELPA